MCVWYSFIGNAVFCVNHITTTYLMTWATNNWREDRTRCVITGETSLAHSRPIVHNQSLNFFVSHCLVIRACDAKWCERRCVRRLEWVVPVPRTGYIAHMDSLYSHDDHIWSFILSCLVHRFHDCTKARMAIVIGWLPFSVVLGGGGVDREMGTRELWLDKQTDNVCQCLFQRIDACMCMCVRVFVYMRIGAKCCISWMVHTKHVLIDLWPSPSLSLSLSL